MDSGARQTERSLNLAPAADATPTWRRAHAGSGLTSALILAYVERRLGPEGVQEVLERAGLSAREEELRDENSWFSFEDKLALWRAAEDVTGDPRIAERVGESTLDFGVALGLKRALRALGSPELIYRNVARANSKFNFAHSLELISCAHDRATLRYRDIAGVGYHHYDCDYTIGLLRTAPELFGLPPARIAHPRCGAQGAECCEFDVHWVGGVHRIWRAGVISCALGIGTMFAGAVVNPVLAAVGMWWLVLTGVAMLALFGVFMQRRVQALEAAFGDRELVAEAQLTSLAALTSELRLEEVLNQILGSTQETIGGAEFALLIAEQHGMRLDPGARTHVKSLRVLEEWTQQHREELTRGPVVLDELSAVPELRRLAVGGGPPVGSLCAAPLKCRGELLGVLVAMSPGSTVFLPHDVRMLETYAGHAAIALSNARLVEALERQALEDPLTGLANQRQFWVGCGAEQDRAAREDRSVGLAVLDVDHFKAINDSYGHPYGNQVLLSVAFALKSVVRAHDTVARIGGEEFALLLPGADVAEARRVAERALQAVTQISLPGGELSMSAGVAAVAGAPARGYDLFSAADHAMYEAKRQGRGRCVVSGAAMEVLIK